VFAGPERRWLVDYIDSNLVSSVGVTEFEGQVVNPPSSVPAGAMGGKRKIKRRFLLRQGG
jgi:hypothetical protein